MQYTNLNVYNIDLSPEFCNNNSYILKFVPDMNAVIGMGYQGGIPPERNPEMFNKRTQLTIN